MRIPVRPAHVLFACVLLLCPGPARADHETPAPELAIPRSTVFTPWRGMVRLFAGEDDNVAMAGEESGYSGTGASPYLGAVGQVNYTKVSLDGWSYGVGGSLGRTIYTTGFENGGDDAPSEYDLTVVQPLLYAFRSLLVAGRAARVEASYDFRSELLEIEEIDSRHHRFVVNGQSWPLPGLALRAGYRYTTFDSDVEFPEPDLNQRDGAYQQAAVEAVYHVPRVRGRVRVSYLRSNSDADGRNFDYEANAFRFRFDNQLSRTLWMDLSVLKDARSYDGFVSNYLPSPGRKAVDILNGKGKLMWKFAPQWVADLHLKVSKIDAETPAFRARRGLGGVGLTYYFTAGRGGR